MTAQYDHFLTLDIGSGHAHIGQFHKLQLIQITPLSMFTFPNPKIDLAMSNVANKRNDLDGLVRTLYSVNNFRQKNSFFEMPVHYGPGLGEDRLVQAYHIYHEMILNGKANSVLLLDAGTFLTIDLINRRGFQGGHIAPGISLLLESYHRGKNLPVLFNEQIDFNRPSFLPQSTEDAMLESIVGLYCGLIERLLELYPGVEMILLTGGEGKIFEGACQRFKLPYLHRPEYIHHALARFYQQSKVQNNQEKFKLIQNL